jgi:YesN/AraC family two-component response regulator
LLAEWGVTAAKGAMRKNYFDTRVLSSRQHQAVVKLLAIFAQHLSLVSNQIVLQEQHAEPPVITRAKQFIAEHQGEELSLEQVAKAVNTSKFYFCKIFKKATGVNFTDYLSRARTERAKNLLLNPNLRVSEIAFEAGFQSLTHFNRVFKKILGQSPTEYRRQLVRG